jgi:hypothetical protein
LVSDWKVDKHIYICIYIYLILSLKKKAKSNFRVFAF